MPHSITDMMRYKEFLESKEFKSNAVGKVISPNEVHHMLYPFQRDIVVWGVRRGRCAIFLDTGMGKTFISLEWSRLIGEKTLIIAPLSVARQTVREGKKINVDLKYVRLQEEVDEGNIFITNYDMAEHFDPKVFGSVVLDESSLLKAVSGKTRNLLIELFGNVKYRLCCTATPAPNDHIELGNHAEFLGVCTEAEMKAMFFINANKEHTHHIDGKVYKIKGTNKGGQEWRLKHHGEKSFYQWLSTWAMTATKPSDISDEYDDILYELPPLNIRPIFVDVDYTPPDQLFFTGLHGIGDRANIRKGTIGERLEALKGIITPDEQWIIWCGLNDESQAVTEAIEGAVEVSGNDDLEYKASVFEKFQDGEIRIIVTKPKIGGYGMNFQNAHNAVFFGLNDSWETFYQAIRRQYRYGQTEPVNIYIICSTAEQEIYQNIMRKEAMAKRLRKGLIEHIRIFEQEELGMKEETTETIALRTEVGDGWTAMLGDSCERLREIGTESIHLSVYSPPFSSLFVYTDSIRDLGNSRGTDEFFEHYKFIIRQVLRVTKPGRLTCVHTSDIPAMASRDGWIGLKDFPGDCIRAYEKEGWDFVGRAFCQKNPQSQAVRTKSKGLLFVQIRKDSTDSRPALVDQILLFKKPGDNAVSVNPVANGELDNEKWIEWAHGIWLGIHESDTLQYHGARSEDDDKHICPLQLETIRRCITLYSNPGETVLTPFGGIGSEAYVALQMKRRAVLIELKESYYDVAVNNLKSIESDQYSLFG